MISSSLLPHVLLRCPLLCLASLTLTHLPPVLLPLCAVAAPALLGWPRKLAPPVLLPVCAVAAPALRGWPQTLAGTTPARWGWPRNPRNRTLLTLSMIESGPELSLRGSRHLLLWCRWCGPTILGLTRLLAHEVLSYAATPLLRTLSRKLACSSVRTVSRGTRPAGTVTTVRPYGASGFSAAILRRAEQGSRATPGSYP